MKYLLITLKVQDGERTHTHRNLHTTNAKNINFAAERYASTYWGLGDREDNYWWFHGEITVMLERVTEVSEYEYKLLSDIFTGSQRSDYFKIVQAGWCEASQREEIQIHAGENGNVFLFQEEDKLGFIVDVYGQKDNINSMTIWEDDLTSNEESDGNWSEIHNDFEDEGFVHIDAWTTADDNEGGKVVAKINVETKEVIYLDERARTNSFTQESIKEVLNGIFTAQEITDFVETWGQTHNAICTALGYSRKESDDLLMDDYFWLETNKKWLPKCSSMYNEREEKLADYLRSK